MDKRRCHRLAMELPVIFHPPDSADSVTFGSTVDVSATGLAILTKEPLELKQVVTLAVQLPDQKWLTIYAEVVRVEEKRNLVMIGGIPEYCIGLKIVDPILGDELTLVRFFAGELRRQSFGKGK